MIPQKPDRDSRATHALSKSVWTAWKLSACKSNASKTRSDQGQGGESSNLATATDLEMMLLKKKTSLLCFGDNFSLTGPDPRGHHSQFVALKHTPPHQHQHQHHLDAESKWVLQVQSHGRRIPTFCCSLFTLVTHFEPSKQQNAYPYLRNNLPCTSFQGRLTSGFHGSYLC